ncbi:MAG: diguanylate cyclase [Deltaproteobacteria bacterium]|nr:diguanylate cyclase [Deltaproteobacteria bacterium]
MFRDTKEKILVIDDSLTFLHGIKRKLVEAGYEVSMANSGPKGIKALEAFSPDCIVLDFSMPEMDGDEVARIISSDERYAHIPILMLTGMDDKNDVLRGLKAGAADYVNKNVEFEILLARLEAVIRKKILYDQLEEAKQRILEQQKHIVEEERIKVLLQITGATAEELNQPLNSLLASIEMLKNTDDIPPRFQDQVKKIVEHGEQITDIVNRMQGIRQDGRLYLSQSASDVVNWEQSISLLVIEDNEADFAAVKELIAAGWSNVTLTRASNLAEGVEMLATAEFDLIFSEYRLPDGHGFDFLNYLAEQQLVTPVIFITSQGNEAVAVRAIKSGAYDYLSKSSLTSETLSKAIQSALDDSRLVREMENAKKRIKEMATTDELTGLHNRRYFTDILKREIRKSRDYHSPMVLAMLDIDFFKSVNDTYGHLAGDCVLSELGKLIAEHIKDADNSGRYGGEEFNILFSQTTLDEAYNRCEAFRSLVAQHVFRHGGGELHITISIGLGGTDGSELLDSEELIRRADSALYAAKAAGRNQTRLYLKSHEEAE